MRAANKVFPNQLTIAGESARPPSDGLRRAPGNSSFPKSLAVLALLWALLPALLVALSPAGAEASRLKVVTTIRPLHCFALNVAGGRAEVENLLPPGVGPHDYSFTPTDAVRLHKADVLVTNGLGLETWLERLLKAARKPALVVVVASRGIEPLPLAGGGHEEARGGHGEHGRWDPHVWLDPLGAARQVENIRDALAAADPEGAELYRANAERYLGRLEALHAEAEEASAGFGNRKLVTFHSAFGYFARRYGLEVVAVIEPAPGKEPTPRLLAQVHKLVKAGGLKVIYTEPQFRPRVAEVLARDLGVATAELDPGVTGPLGPEAYEEFMRRNLKVLADWQGR